MKTRSTRRLRARAAAINPNDSEFDDYGPEPNMKLSHAFLVVLLLHVIAVGGLYAFNTMKANKAPKLAVAKATTPAAPAQSDSSSQSASQGPNQEDPDNNRPPSKEKDTLAAKSGESTKTTENAPKVVENAAPKSSQPHQGLMGSIKAALLRLTGAGAGTAAVSSAAAQEATSAETAPATQAVTVKTYVVKAGDTITKISSSLGVTILDLEKTNGLVGSSVLRVGQTLKVPEKMIAQAASDVGSEANPVAGSVQQLPATIASAATAAAASAQGVSNAPTVTGDMIEYTVVKGDSPYRIAKKFKVTPDEIMKANNITDPKKIQIGQKLKIPASSKKAAQKVPAAQ